MEKTSNLINLSAINNLLGGLGLISILIVTLGVLTRFVLKVSIAWSDELLRTLFVWAYFIGTALQFRYDGLMRLELLDLALIKRNKWTAYKFVLRSQFIAIAAFSGLMVFNASTIIQKQIINKQVTTTSGVPAWIVPLGFTIGLLMLMIISIVKLTKPLD